MRRICSCKRISARRSRDFSVRSPTRKLPFRLRVQYSGRVGRRSCTSGPSRPGDLHPEPLTDSGRKPLDLSGSCHPLKAAAFHRDRRVPPVNPLTLFDRDAGDLLPSLFGHYPVSTLIRSSPPLGGASVLSDSWFIHLCLFPFHRQPGSQVPHESPD